MAEMIEELAEYYAVLGYPMYSKEELEAMSEMDVQALYDMTFPDR